MSESLSPEMIYNQFLAGDVKKKKAINLLMLLLEISEVATIRSQSINLLEKVGIMNNGGFKVLENCLISDENATVRASALNLILNRYLDKSLTLLGWVIEHEKSPLILKKIFDCFDNYSNKKFIQIKEKIRNWDKKFSSLIGIVPEEVRFFLDIEALFARDKENYEIEPASYKHFEVLSDVKGGEPWLLIKREHVEVLNFNYFNWMYIKENQEIVKSLLKLNDLNIYFKTINKYTFNKKNPEIPASIGKLTNLRKLILKRNDIQIIPTSIRRLVLLKELNLSCNNLSEIPQMLEFLNSLEILNLKHNKVQNIPESLRTFLNSLNKFRF